MDKYVIGIDFGSLSGRACLVNAKTGEELCSSTLDYSHGVMTERLPDGTPLGTDWALQVPSDYIAVLTHTIPEILKSSGVAPADIIGIGTDFTACTILPITADGTPLCDLPRYSSAPHAYVKLWKHHAAQSKANLLNALAAERGEKWLARYGGKISSEFEIPKVMQLVDEAPEIYAAADSIIEAGDWIVMQLCGTKAKSACAAGYKGTWNAADGYPSPEFFAALDPRLENFVAEKLNFPIVQLGERVGGLTTEMAEKLGLCPNIAVSSCIIDAHAGLPAAKVTKAGQLLAIMGTSTCHIMVSDREVIVPGICGVVEGGIYPGLYGYEAGQACVGDHFAWCVEHCGAEYAAAAMAENLSLHEYLTKKAAALKAGQSGLLALDWWNGNRSTLVDGDLSGLLLGLTLSTKPEEIYRALIEATAYGTREIVENFREGGVPVHEFIASGGISRKNPLAMQIYADVLNMPIRIAGSQQSGALGSACYAAVAAGADKGGYATIFEAAAAMGKLEDTVYTPNPANAEIYNALYAEYDRLYAYFGKGENDVMHTLKAMKTQSKSAN